MAAVIFYVDESGDLGWKFTAPYHQGGSSRYLTIAALICPVEKQHLPKRVIRRLYKTFAWDTRKEKKWADMGIKARKNFCYNASRLVEQNPGIRLFSITVAKERVNDAIRRDGNILYNYMIKLSLADEMTRYDKVLLSLDERSIKVQSGNSLRDYLRIHLSCERQAATELITKPCDSACEENIQFTDMLAGLIQNHYENKNSECWDILSKHITAKQLFFP